MGLRDSISQLFSNRSSEDFIKQRVIDAVENRMDAIRREGHKDQEDTRNTLTGKIKEWFKIVKRKLGFDRYYSNPYDFKTLRTAYENEIYVRRAVDHYIEAVMRNGYDIVGETEDDVLYIKRRLAEMEMVSDITTADIIRESTAQLVLYGNLIAHLVRNVRATSGSTYTRFDGKEMQPIAAVFVEDTRAMKIKNDEKRGLQYERYYDTDYYFSSNTETLTKWANLGIGMYGSSGSGLTEKTPLSKDDIYHIGFHRHPGDVWATPPFAPVIDDIRTLRLIEENVELLIFQYSHSILHAKVGDKDKRGTKPEIDDVTRKIEGMDSNGFMVTDHRVELDYKSGGEAVELSKYLSYFKSRVYAGLYMSDVSMGEGDTANRSTADVLSKDSVKRTTELQQYIQSMFRNLFKEFLFERGYKYTEVNDHVHRVELVFPEVDIDAKIKVEEHVSQLFVQNLLTIDEARQKIGMKPITDEELDRTYSRLVTMAQNEHQNEMDTAKATTLLGAKMSAGMTTTAAASKSAKSANKTQQRSRPVNQYGRKVTSTLAKK